MADKLRIGLIGCGGQGRYLSEAAAISDRAELIACADVRPEAAHDVRNLFGYRETYEKAETMLEQAHIDAVIVATTHDQLQPMALLAVEAGKHVLVEKPMALNVQQAQDLVDAAREARVKLMVGYTLRFIPARLEMKRLLDKGAVGDITTVLAGQLIGPMGGWLAQREHGGGPLFYVGTHALDQILWIADAPARRVYAEVVWKEGGVVEAEAAATIRFDGGIIGQLVTSQRMGGRYGWIDVIGSAGRIRNEWESSELYVESRKIAQYSRPTRIDVPPNAHHPDYPPEATARLSGFKYVRSWAAEITEFIEAVHANRDPSPSGRDALRVLQVVGAIFSSARTGKPIDLQ